MFVQTDDLTHACYNSRFPEWFDDDGDDDDDDDESAYDCDGVRWTLLATGCESIWG